MKVIFFFLGFSFAVCGQSHYEFIYDSSGNRLAKELVGNTPIPTITGDTLACAGQSKTFTVSQANVSSYKWDNGATTQSLSFVADSSRYRKVTVTYTSGCQNTGRRWIQVSNPSIGNLVGSTSVSLNQNISYNLSDYKPSDNYKWEIVNGSITGSTTTAPINVSWNINSTPSSLMVTRKVGNCSNTKTFPITVSGTTPCANNSLVLVNPTNNQSSGATTFKVGQTIGATNKLTGGNTDYIAGKSIILNPGFEARAGNFVAQIAGCN